MSQFIGPELKNLNQKDSKERNLRASRRNKCTSRDQNHTRKVGLRYKSRVRVRVKARLTARGDLVDAEELDFQEIFSPVVSWPGLRIFLALTVLLDLKPLQIDVDLAYLCANLEEPVYMRPPDGAGCPPGKV